MEEASGFQKVKLFLSSAYASPSDLRCKATNDKNCESLDRRSRNVLG